MFWPLTRPKMPFKVMHRKEVTHSDGSYERKPRGRKLADEMGRGKKCPWYTHRLTHGKFCKILLKKSSCVCLFIVSLWCCRWIYNTIITSSPLIQISFLIWKKHWSPRDQTLLSIALLLPYTLSSRSSTLSNTSKELPVVLLAVIITFQLFYAQAFFKCLS